MTLVKTNQQITSVNAMGYEGGVRSASHNTTY